MQTPKTLDSLRDELAEKSVLQSGASLNVPYFPQSYFKEGWDAALAALSEGVEFDEDHAKKMASALYESQFTEGETKQYGVRLMRDQFEKCKAQVGYANWASTEFGNKIEQLERELAEAKLANEAGQVELDLANKLCVERKNAYDHANAQLLGQAQRIREQMKEVDRLKTSTGSRILIMRDRQVIEKDARIAELERELEIQDEANEILTRDLGEMKLDNAALIEERTALKAKNDKQSYELSDLESVAQGKKNRIEELEKEIGECYERKLFSRRKLESELENAKAEIKSLAAHLKIIQDDMNASEATDLVGTKRFINDALAPYNKAEQALKGGGE